VSGESREPSRRRRRGESRLRRSREASGALKGRRRTLIRRAEAGDIDRILDLSSRLYSEDGDVPFDRARASAALETLVRSEQFGLVLVADELSRVVGFLVLVWGFSLESGGKDAFVDELYVASGWRGRGIGTALLGAAEAACAANGADTVHLVVERSNAGAERLYRRLGFTGRHVSLLTKRLS
jgi:ribosomal protein S18 acetylase RimI-like enzyme